jgi:hypothetical protein
MELEEVRRQGREAVFQVSRVDLVRQIADLVPLTARCFGEQGVPFRVLAPAVEFQSEQERLPEVSRRTHRGRMTLRSVPEAIKSLRATLNELERATDIARDSMDFAQLKRIFLKRIAELEIERARAKVDKLGYKIAS